jgi:hypothetical protein
MRLFLRLLLTGKDNATYDITRFLLLLGFISFVGLAAWDVLIGGHAFDPSGYSLGLTGILFGGSGGIALKARTEPEPGSGRVDNPDGE